MKFLAVDPSSTVLGWAVFLDDALLSWGIINTLKEPYDHRFMYIVGELQKLRELHGFTEVACERAIRFAGRRIPALEVAVISIRKWAEMRKMRIDFYSPAEWKKSVTGNGSAGKQDVAKAIYLAFSYLAFPRGSSGLSEHITDAIGIGQHHYGVRKLERMAG